MIEIVKNIKQEAFKSNNETTEKEIDLKDVPIDKQYLSTINNIAQKPYSHFDLKVDFKNSEI